MRYKITARLRADPKREYVFYTTVKEVVYNKDPSEAQRKARALKDVAEQVEVDLGQFEVVRAEEAEEETTDA